MKYKRIVREHLAVALGCILVLTASADGAQAEKATTLKPTESKPAQKRAVVLPQARKRAPQTQQIRSPAGVRVKRTVRPRPARASTPPKTTRRIVQPVPASLSPVRAVERPRPVPGTSRVVAERVRRRVSAGENFILGARVFAAGKPARREGRIGYAHLRSDEKNLTSFLGYRDYRLLKEGGHTVLADESYHLSFGKKRTVTVTPLGEKNGRVKVRVLWELPGEPAWRKTLYFKRNMRSMVGGPRVPGGGMYLLSLEVR